MRTIALLTISNIFMTFAWYGHLKYREVPLYKVIAVSWLIAFFEYCFQVPANRIGSYEFSAAQPGGVRPDRRGRRGDLQEMVRQEVVWCGAGAPARDLGEGRGFQNLRKNSRFVSGYALQA